MSEERLRGRSALRVVNGSIEKFDPHATDAKPWAMTALSDRVEIYGPGDIRLVVSLPASPYAHAVIKNVLRLVDAANRGEDDAASQPAPAQPEGSVKR